MANLNNTVFLDKKLDIAISRIHLKFSLISPLLFSLGIKIIDGSEVFTDGKCIYFGRDVLDNKQHSELLFILLHELFHVTFCHTYFNNGGNLADIEIRKLAYEYIVNAEASYYMWNLFDSDYSFNSYCYICDNHYKILGRSNFNRVKKDDELEYILYCPNCYDMGKETYLDVFKKLKDKLKDRIICTDFLVLINDFKFSEDEKEQIEREIKRIFSYIDSEISKELHKNKGSISNNLLREINLLSKGKISWKNLLENYLFKHLDLFGFKTMSIHKYNFSHPLFLKNKILINKLVNKKPEKIVIAVDSSGSIDEFEYNEFMTEVYKILCVNNNLKVTFIVCDCEIKGVIHDLSKNNFSQVKNISLGGGGTNFIPVFNFIKEKLDDDIKLLIYLTDGFGDYPKEIPNYRILWVLNSNYNVPFGEKINMKDDYTV